MMFDSYLAAGMSYRDDNTGEFFAAAGPENRSLAQDQWTWIEQTLSTSTADYLFTAAHYPVRSLARTTCAIWDPCGSKVWSACNHCPA